MGLRISGKNLDIGDALRGHIDGRVGEAVAKYFDGGFTGHVTVEREGSGFRSDCLIHLDTGIVLQAEGRGQEARQSFDAAAEKVEKRLRRYNRRLRGHNHDRRATEAADAYVIAAPAEDAEVAPDYSPTIVAEETTELGTLTVGEAVMAMDLAEMPVLVFRHAGHGGINVVYRRSDGNFGWIDPSRSAKKEGAGH